MAFINLHRTFSKENILTVLSSLSSRAHQRHEKAGILVGGRFCDNPKLGTELIFAGLAVAKLLNNLIKFFSKNISKYLWTT